MLSYEVPVLNTDRTRNRVTCGVFVYVCNHEPRSLLIVNK